MRRLTVLFLLLLSAVPSYGQEEIVPDTLDWRGYYPLQVGNIWEWSTQIIVAYTGFDRREIVADTMLDGRRYYVQVRYASGKDPNNGVDFARTDTLYLRYDTANNKVVALRASGEEKEDSTCDLSTAFGDMILCEVMADAYVGGGYAGEGDYLHVGDDPVSYNAIKDYYNLGGGVTYFHGIGPLPGIGDGSAGSTAFTYLRLDGREYGERAQIVATEDAPGTHPVSITLFPNPARDRLRIAVEAAQPPLTLTVYDLLGRAVLPAQPCTPPQCTLDVSPLPAGVYFVRTEDAADRRAAAGHFAVVR